MKDLTFYNRIDDMLGDYMSPTVSKFTKSIIIQAVIAYLMALKKEYKHGGLT